MISKLWLLVFATLFLSALYVTGQQPVTLPPAAPVPAPVLLNLICGPGLTCVQDGATIHIDLKVPEFDVFKVVIPAAVNLGDGPVPVRAGFASMSIAYEGAPYVTVAASEIKPAAPCALPGAIVPGFLCGPAADSQSWQWTRALFLTF